MSAKELAEHVVAIQSVLDDAAVEFALGVAADQVEGKLKTTVESAEIIRTTNCFLSGECNCFQGMVGQLIAEVSGEDPEPDEKFAEWMHSIVTSRVQ